MSSNRMMSAEAGERFIACLEALRKTHEYCSKEAGNTPVAIFDALRIYMTVAAAYLVRSGMPGTDEDMRKILRDLLELGIGDFQFNERMHVGSKGAS